MINVGSGLALLGVVSVYSCFLIWTFLTRKQLSEHRPPLRLDSRPR